MNTAHRIAMIRRARERNADRFVRSIVPHLRGDDTPHAIDPDALDEIAAATVRTRGVA